MIIKKQLYCVMSLLFFLSICPLLAQTEIPVEFGMNFGIAKRHEDSFSRGMQKFRSSLNPNTSRVVQVDPFPSVSTYEYFMRFAVLDSKKHYIGFSFGRFLFSNTPLYELRSDGVVTTTNWSFRLPYFMFTYTYSNLLYGRWNRKLKLEWDGGAGFGYITGARWNVNGASVSNAQNVKYNINQRGRLGNIARLDLGLKRQVLDGMFLRMGLSATYTHVGTWDGEINDGEGTFYQLQDGSLIPLSSFAYLSANTIVAKNSDLTGSSLIKSKAIFNSGFTVLKIGLIYRF